MGDTEKDLSKQISALTKAVTQLSSGGKQTSLPKSATQATRNTAPLMSSDQSYKAAEKYQRDLIKGQSLATRIYSRMLHTALGRFVIKASVYVQQSTKQFFSRVGGGLNTLFRKVFGDLMDQLQPIIEIMSATARYAWDMIIKPLGKLGLSLLSLPFQMLFRGHGNKIEREQLKEAKKQTKELKKIAANSGGSLVVGKKSGLLLQKQDIVKGGASYKSGGVLGTIKDIGTTIWGGISSLFSMGSSLLGDGVIGTIVKGVLTGGAVIGGWKLFKEFFPNAADTVTSFYDKTIKPIIVEYGSKIVSALVDGLKTGFIEAGKFLLTPEKDRTVGTPGSAEHTITKYGPMVAKGMLGVVGAAALTPVLGPTGAVIGFYAGTKAADAIMNFSDKVNIFDNSKRMTKSGAVGVPTTTDESAAYKSFKDKLAFRESRGNNTAANPDSTARGKYQFIDATWIRLAKKAGVSTDLSGKTNEVLSERVMDEAIKEYSNALKAAGLEVNEVNLRMCHFLGTGGAVKALKAGRESILGNFMSEGGRKNHPKLAMATVGRLQDIYGKEGFANKGVVASAVGGVVSPEVKATVANTEATKANTKAVEGNTNPLDEIISGMMDVVKSSFESVWNLKPGDLNNVGGVSERLQRLTISDAQKELAMAQQTVGDIQKSSAESASGPTIITPTTQIGVGAGGGPQQISHINSYGIIDFSTPSMILANTV